MGHASIVETMDRYGHLLPGDETEAAGLMDDYLSAAGKSLLSRVWQMAPSFSPGHFSASDRIMLSVYNNTDIMWTDLESTSARRPCSRC